MLDRVFGESALHLNKKLDAAAASGELHDFPLLCLPPQPQPVLATALLSHAHAVCAVLAAISSQAVPGRGVLVDAVRGPCLQGSQQSRLLRKAQRLPPAHPAQPPQPFHPQASRLTWRRASRS